MNRRYFLKSASLSAVSLGFLGMPKFFVKTLQAQYLNAPSRDGKVLVNIFMRGAVDGLNVVVPYGEDNYYSLRSSIAIPRPSTRLRQSRQESRGPTASEDAALDLDGFFGVNPRMKNIQKMFQAREAVFIHASGSPDGTRSHFEAQNFMEAGTPGVATTETGWLNRTMTQVDGTARTPFELVAITPELPLSLRGDYPALCFNSIDELKFGSRDSEEFSSALAEMYSSSQVLGGSVSILREAMKVAKNSKIRDDDNSNYPAYPLAKKLHEVAKLIKMNVGLQIAFVDVEGWDTHVNEGGTENGVLPNLLKQFDESIKAFRDDLGEKFGNVVVVTMSEFGRTVHENGNGGTDHGHANVMMVFGGNVNGGRVAGKWPGLNENDLYQGRDLALATDFRTVLSEAITKHLGVQDVAPVFPGFEYSGSNLVFG